MSNEIDNKDIVEGVTKGFLGVIIDNLRKVFRKSHLCVKYPRKTVIFALKPKEAWWHMGGMKGNPGMQIVCRCDVTNITKDLNIKLVTAIFKKTKTYGFSVLISNFRAIENDMIPPGCMAESDFNFWVKKPFRKKGQSFVSDIIIYDQFNNKYIIKNIEFKYS